MWCIKIADIAIPTTSYFLTLNVGVVFICLAVIYYLSLSLGSFLGMMFFGFLASVLCISLEMSPVSLFTFSLVMFVLAWAGQFIGHHIEGERPAFTEDLQFLLVSPAWLLDALYKKPRRGFLALLGILVGSYLSVNLLFSMDAKPDFLESLERAEQYEGQIVRDEWGVPHIIGKPDADTAYGLALPTPSDQFTTTSSIHGLPVRMADLFANSKKFRRNGGVGGIRTHVPVTRQDAFEAPPLRPLRYLSELSLLLKDATNPKLH